MAIEAQVRFFVSCKWGKHDRDVYKIRTDRNYSGNTLKHTIIDFSVLSLQTTQNSRLWPLATGKPVATATRKLAITTYSCMFVHRANNQLIPWVKPVSWNRFYATRCHGTCWTTTRCHAKRCNQGYGTRFMCCKRSQGRSQLSTDDT